eukprot:TRINITY_DN557_c0_g2_i1.p1 TRINITY_DN557_c0_g2~~TRINITY_DN557_c0_g2_i1.p1  ORF type:complete len:425 (+),score=184.03 TRINITY_DN557_c0_g2_i1:129-1277(+)
MIDPKKKTRMLPRYFFLFHDVLLLCTPSKKDYSRFKVNVLMDFKKKNLELQNTDEALVITSTTKAKSFEFVMEGRDEWAADIQRALALELEPPSLDAPKLDGPYDPYNLQTEEQKKVFDGLRAKLEERDPPLTPLEKEWTDDACLCRYLRARQYDLEKSYKMLDASLLWRASFKPETITAAEIAPEASSGKVYVSTSRDWAGRPVVYMRPGKDTDADPDTKIKFVVWVLENASNIMNTNETGVEKMTWIVDFSNSSVGAPNGDSVKVSKDTLHIVQDHYPERLGNAFMLNAPFVFNAFWKVLSPFIDPVTKQKVQFLKKKEEYKKLKLYIPEESLEAEYGGTSTFEYDFEDWKRRMGVDVDEQRDGDAAATSSASSDAAPPS